jgi:hypothetical protein
VSEADIVYQLSEIYNRYWVVLQWWTGTTFVLLGVAHVASSKLHIFINVILTLLYSLFSLWILNFNNSNILAINGFIKDLIALEEAGVTISYGAKGYLEGYHQISQVLPVFVSTSMYFCAVGFIIYSTTS